MKTEKQMMDLLLEMAKHEHIDQKDISSKTIGNVFLMVSRSDDGHGLCAMPDSPDDSKSLTNYMQRVELQANLNALINNKNSKYAIDADPLSQIPNKENIKIALIGFIESIYFRLIDKGYKVNAFDLVKKSPEITPIHHYEDCIRAADYVLATGTSITNNSISEYRNWIRDDASLLIIGPSTPLSTYLFELIKPLKGLYGSIITDPGAARAAVKEGFGTRALMPFMKKASLTR